MSRHDLNKLPESIDGSDSTYDGCWAAIEELEQAHPPDADGCVTHEQFCVLVLEQVVLEHWPPTDLGEWEFDVWILDAVEEDGDCGGFDDHLLGRVRELTQLALNAGDWGRVADLSGWLISNGWPDYHA